MRRMIGLLIADCGWGSALRCLPVGSAHPEGARRRAVGVILRIGPGKRRRAPVCIPGGSAPSAPGITFLTTAGAHEVGDGSRALRVPAVPGASPEREGV